MNEKKVERAMHYRGGCWMGGIRNEIKSLPMSELFIIGTHNSATYDISVTSSFGSDAPGLLGKKTMGGKLTQLFARPVCAKWAKCQSLTIREQLNNGVRYLDIRVIPKSEKNTTPYISHSQVSVPLRDVVNEIVSFLACSENTWECLVVDLQHLSIPEGMLMDSFLFPALEPLRDLCIPNTVSLSTPLEEIWRRSKKERVFLVIGSEFDSEKYTFAFMRHGAIVSDWKNVQNCNDLLQRFDEDLAHPVTHQSGVFCVTQGVLTPEGKQIMDSLLFTKGISTKFNSIMDMARKVNAPICKWFWKRNRHRNEDNTCGNMHRNILMLDYPQITSLTIEVDDGGSSIECSPVIMCILLNLLK
ncbi:variant-surface-glycoprotein phospholipase C [Strigomonas culicis]|uniref:Variant-surface-glycoprotein phospholipase C n=1 Tax=Strigomonas culicis TaxID=28005 RepID=S9U974_9TRYP|nr:variant-surface-glycoprotein phospholipase C [Strigomonas culicis]|eukprot:EPY27322.1 variant-surface-glycoprotein phospholipase C [Strigomonas culicis]